MKVLPVILIAIVAGVSCSPTHEENAVSNASGRIGAVREKLKLIHMEDRVDEHYSGGDIGAFLDQIVWSDDAMILARTQFGPFFEFFDTLRKAAIEKDMSKHSPITNPEIPLIFPEVFRDANPFGDLQKTPLPIEVFYQNLELYRSGLLKESKGKSGPLD